MRYLALLLTLVACSSPAERAARVAADSVRADSVARARQDSINRAQPGYVVDSIFPIPEALRRFRTAIGGETATALTGGSSTREALVERLVKAIAAADTLTVRAMAVTPREFADLYYPESPYSRPPYQQQPAFAWEMIRTPSDGGMHDLFRKLGGSAITYVSHTCAEKVERSGATTRYTDCVVTTRDATAGEFTRRLFGSILEHRGQFKFLSYTNKL
jgi:hypothetical protein